MSSPFLGLRTLGYRVTDITAAKNWYKDILGIEPYFDMPFYVGFNVAGYELGLATEEHVDISKTDNATTYWGVENVQEVYDMLLSKGAIEHEKPTDVGEGIIVAAVKDPWNNVFGIIYNPHFKLP
jgi:lactoylglutathione lyase